MISEIIGNVFCIIFIISVILFVFYVIKIFRDKSKINKFVERMYIGNKYISKKLSISNLNPFVDYTLVELIDCKRNIAGIIYVRFKYTDNAEFNVEYTASINDFIKEFRIYKYAPSANNDFKKEIHQID